MDNKKVNSINLIIVFLLSYSFYIIQFLSQEIFYFYSKQSILIFCLFQLFFPFLVLFVCKIINKKTYKTNLVTALFKSIYLIITSIMILLNLTNVVLLYYTDTKYIILLLFLFLPIIYTFIKGSHLLFYLSFIFFVFYIIFKYTYISNMTLIDYYPFYNLLNINYQNIIPIIIFELPILIEPFLLLDEKNTINNKINLKITFIISLIIALVGIYTVLRQVSEYDLLLDKIRFPYLESIKNVVAGNFFENIDYYYLFSISLSLYIRITYALHSIQNSLSLNKKMILIVIIFILVITYILKTNMILYEFCRNKLLIISSIALLLYSITHLLIKKEKIHD